MVYQDLKEERPRAPNVDPLNAPRSFDFCFITSQSCFPLTGSAPALTALIMMIRGLLLMLFLRLQNLCPSQSPWFSGRILFFYKRGFPDLGQCAENNRYKVLETLVQNYRRGSSTIWRRIQRKTRGPFQRVGFQTLEFKPKLRVSKL